MNHPLLDSSEKDVKLQAYGSDNDDSTLPPETKNWKSIILSNVLTVTFLG